MPLAIGEPQSPSLVFEGQSYVILLSLHLWIMKASTHLRLVLLTVGVLLFSCRQTAEIGLPLGNEPTWSEGDSLAFYFPQNQRADLGFQHTGIDTFTENWYSSALFSFREPVLYGKCSEGGIYRFLWLRAFGPPVVFVLSRSGDQVTLTTKVLDHQPEFLESKYDPRGWSGLMEQLKGKTIERFGDSLIVVKADRKATIVSNRDEAATYLEWTKFEQLLAQAGFSRGRRLTGIEATTGRRWVIEACQGPLPVRGAMVPQRLFGRQASI